MRFSHRFATSLTLKQYVCNVLSAGSTESAPVYGIFLHSAVFPEEASRMGFSDKFKEKYFLAFNTLFSLHLLTAQAALLAISMPCFEAPLLFWVRQTDDRKKCQAAWSEAAWSYFRLHDPVSDQWQFVSTSTGIPLVGWKSRSINYHKFSDIVISFLFSSLQTHTNHIWLSAEKSLWLQ